MKLAVAVVCSILIGGCGGEGADERNEPREPISVDSLAIDVRVPSRSFMLSDKRGGFLSGIVGGPTSSLADVIWSVEGNPVVKGFAVTIGSGKRAPISSTRVFPHHVVIHHSDGSTETISPLEVPTAYAMVIRVQRTGAAPILLSSLIVPGFERQNVEDNIITWVAADGLARVSICAGPYGRVTADGSAVGEDLAPTYLLVYEKEPPYEDLARLHSRIPTLLRARSDRMERLLNKAYIKTSDQDLNKALYWTRLSLDALLLTRPNPLSGVEERVAIAGFPWDGTFRGREIAIAIPGLDFALNDYATTSTILRWLAARQDTVVTHRTYGRIADKISPELVTFNSGDVTPWFVRQMYEHVTNSYDTALVRDLAPVVKRSIKGTIRYHTDEQNLITHGAGETWMDASVNGRPATPRGNRAAEMQLLWYFQQLIGGFVEQYTGDSLTARSLSAQAARTAESFNAVFIDTSRQLPYDHLLPTGEGVAEVRPNVLFCVDILGSELIQQTMIKSVVNAVVYPWGVGTLAQNDPKFRPYSEEEGRYSKEEAIQNGPVWTWLAGQLTYALSRYDRQDLTYTITRGMVQRILTTDMVGALPEAFDAVPRHGEALPRAAGLQMSLTGMAEFVRSIYQDYLGVRVDAIARQMWIQPKLPDEMRHVDFTVNVGAYPVHGRYVRDNESARVILDAPNIPEPLKINFIWIFMNGDAWKGVATLQPAKRLTLIFGPDDLVAYSGEDIVELPSTRKLKGFSMRDQFTGIGFAGGK